MSVLGLNMLENVVKKNNALQPAKVLDALNEEVVARLSGNESEGTMKNGIDIAFISINREKDQLEYAGAHNSIYIVRGQELIEIKSDKMTIGFDNKENTISYTNQTMELKTGDMIYLFTDGFPDQIGGPKRKKYYYQPFRELLISLSSVDSETQRRKLDEAHEQWLDNKYEQTDDILIMGIRY